MQSKGITEQQQWRSLMGVRSQYYPISKVSKLLPFAAEKSVEWIRRVMIGLFRLPESVTPCDTNSVLAFHLFMGFSVECFICVEGNAQL